MRADEAAQIVFPDPPRRRRPEPAHAAPPTVGDVSEPHVRRDGETFVFTWPSHGVAVGVERIRDTTSGLEAEVFVSSSALGDLHWGRLLLASTNGREALVRKLNTAAPDVPWRAIFERVCRHVVVEVRRGEPVVQLVPVPLPVRPRYLVEPLLPQNAVTVLYGDGGVGKGYIALAIALAVSAGRDLPGLRSHRVAPVLYLDWESDRADHEERLALLQRGLALDDVPPLYY